MVTIEDRKKQFREAVEACPDWLKDRLKGGEQINCYETGDSCDDDHEDEREYVLSVGPITSFAQILPREIETKWRADLIESAFKLAAAAIAPHPEASVDEVTAMHRLLERCSCCEVWGENPACELHGEHTPWGKANPDPQRAGLTRSGEGG